MIFYTENSVYEVDLQGKRVRRLRGIGDPMPRLGKDGEWRPYASISPILKGLPVLIVWTSDTPLHDGSNPWLVPTTLTSDVKNIASDQN